MLWLVVIWISVVEIAYLETVNVAVDYNDLDREVEKQCIQHCQLQNQTDVTRLDYNCNYECNTEQCSKGCVVWRDSLTSSCHRACNGTSDRLSQRELHCVIGCNDAIGKYFGRVRTVLGKPPAPALLDNSLTATTLKLEWRFKEASRARLTAHLQWRYEEIAATWQYCRNVTWEPEISSFHVQALQPYTKYRFRVALNLGLHNFGADAIYSERSVVIATLAAGPPASPPQHVHAAPVDAHSVSVTWEPGPFPHGPLLSYVLHITETGASARPGYQGRTEVKDVPSTTTFYLFRDVPANENWTVSVQMRNSFGPGPASVVHVTTPKEVKASENLQPVLILGTKHGIYQVESLFGDSLHLFDSDETEIKGIGIHIDKQLLFVSDADGYVWKFPVEQETKNRTAILSPGQLDVLPLDISVDWISDLLYIVGEMKSVKSNAKKMFLIQRCTLDGRALTVAYAGLQSRPTAMEVDPCNGYIFWSVHDDGMSGLYRLDTSDISNGIKHEKRPDLILRKPNLGAFLIDCSNFRLYVADQGANTILSLSLDGKSVKNVRANVVRPNLQYVLSLGMVNQKFYWTDGATVYNEEYHKGHGQYYHNHISHLGKTNYQKILINMNGSQPWPIPLNPPTSLQLIFGSTIAKAKWLAPHLLPLQGKGACQKWTYELFVHDVASNATVTYYSQTPSIKFGNLKPNTDYLIKVLAFTKSGKGPWSVEFRGRTLDNTRNSSIIWSGSEGLVRTDPVMDKVETLIHKSRMRNIAFDDMTWYKDQIYLVTNSSQVYWLNLTSRKQGRLIDVDSVGSIAVDWIGQKLYWSNLKQQLIIRGNLNGSKQEPLPILALVKEIRIDSLNGYLYWSSGFDVECAHLNGDDKIHYDHLEPFSGKQVMGLTLDFDSHYVYWIVRGQEGSHLFRAPTMKPGVVVSKVKVALLARTNIAGPLSYFNGRLLWLRDEKIAAISDTNGAHVATMEGKSLFGLKMVYAIDDSLQRYSGDDSENKLNVIPDLADRTSIRTVGSSESFNITWAPILNVNYGTVFYEVQLDGPYTNYSSIVTSESSIGYLENVSPFTPLNVTIRPFTYWASAPQTRIVVYSPPSTPSAPTNLRAFVSYDHNNSLRDFEWFSIAFRWDPPTHPNGILQGYYVRCWYTDNRTEKINLCDGIVKPANETEHVLNELTTHQLFSFQVQAYTEIGTGILSAVKQVNSKKENPVPKLLTLTKDSIWLRDLDSNRSTALVTNVNTPVKVVYLLRENKLFWINEMRELLVLHSTNNRSKLADLKGEPKGLTIDWLGRCLYVLEGFNHTNGSVIKRVDLNYSPVSKVVPIYVNATGSISEIAVSPYAKKLYWNENGTVFSSNLDVSNIKRIYPSDATVDRVEKFQLNHHLANLTLTYLLSNNRTVTTNEDGQNCCSDVVPVNDFSLQYGKQVQPYPSRRCLSPHQSTDYSAVVLKKSYDYLTLGMPEAIFGTDCPRVSVPPSIYTGTYAMLPHMRENTFTTLEKTYRLGDLKPFTEYSVRIAVTNFYTDVNEIKFGQPLVVKTSPGAPSKPRNITASVLHPTLAVTKWLPPHQLNGEIVHYEIHWLTEGSLTGVRQKGEQSVNEFTTAENHTVLLTALLQKLSPNETYTVWIRAYSETNETSSDSDRVHITTYPEPAVFDLINKTSRSLQLIWEITSHIQDYYVQYAPITSTDQWERVQAPERKEDVVNIFVGGLTPKTQYKFRLSLLYEQYPRWYVWPSDSRFTFETLGDRPNPPGQPGIQVYGTGDRLHHKVVWDAPVDNGAPIVLYSLECLALRWYRRSKRSAAQIASNWSYAAPSADETPFEWEQVYNGTDNFWTIEGLNPAHKYAFRVSALNSYGWSDLSAESSEFNPGEAEHLHQKSPMDLIFIATLLPISICIIIVVCFGYVTYSRRCRKQKVVEQVPVRRGPDVELATLRELPRHGVHSTNILYVPSPNPGEELPHIRRDQIQLTKFLGCGAFGEVFEAKAKDLSADAPETRVAVKTFKKGASLKKSEFLQEAELMNHFKHEHILKLLGVCLDNDPPFIIMELMEGGDLLKYLRDSRHGLNNKPLLKLIDLLKMCLDVTKGCRYLEIMHFVHRDLACRNCLVSSVERENRIVKIGDFGLARDIYKNDYYKKAAGEAMLPVRWMAPESLLDGVFTCQSDVWAYGVLLWEIMTLGQQPYQARDNLEVLHYLKNGGRLGKPKDCPEELYELMLKCWTFEADKRPMFKHCLEVMDKAYNNHLTIAASQLNYISTVPDLFEGISNAAYFLDENRNASDTSWKTSETEDVDEANKEKTPFLTKEIPKYLELVFEPEKEDRGELPNDGYEVPTEMLRSVLGETPENAETVTIASESLNNKK